MRAEVAAETTPARRDLGPFPCFDGLRAVAALSVFTFHFLGVHRSTWLRGTALAYLSRLGGQGVGIFFVISGFLLYRPFVVASIRGLPSPPLGPFWLRRFVRIFPAYWIAFTAFIYVFGLRSVHGFANVVTFYGLLQNYRGGYALLGLGVAWTLVIEVSFYVVLPFINQAVRAIAGRDAGVERVFRVQVGMLVVLVATAFGVRVLNIWFVTTSRPGAWFPLHASGYSVFGYLDWFAVGMAFAVLSAFSSAGRTLPRAITALGRFPSASWALAFAVFTLQTRLHNSPPNRWISFSLPCLIAITAGFVVLPAVFGRQDEGLIRRGLNHPLMVWLGTISYGIYLWHFTFVSLSIRWVVEGQLANVLLVRFIVVATLTLVTASASFYLVEKPLTGWSRRISQRRSLRTAQPAR